MTCYSEEHISFLKDGYRTMPIGELTEAFNDRFGLDKTKRAVKAALERRNIRAPVDEHGRHRGLYRKGRVAHNRVEAGHERKVGDDFILVRQPDGTDKMKHVAIWESHNGPLPEGSVILFLDGDKTNFDIENLELLTRRELLMANMRHYNHVDEKLKPPVLSLSKLLAKIGTLEERRK